LSTAGTGITDDLDIALCTLDLTNNKMIYSGVGNPLYHITGVILLSTRPAMEEKEVMKRENMILHLNIAAEAWRYNIFMY